MIFQEGVINFCQTNSQLDLIKDIMLVLQTQTLNIWAPMICLSSHIYFFIAYFSLCFWVCSYHYKLLSTGTVIYNFVSHPIFINLSLQFVALYLQVFFSSHKIKHIFSPVAVTWSLHTKQLFWRIWQNSYENTCDAFKLKLMKKEVGTGVFFWVLRIV